MQNILVNCICSIIFGIIFSNFFKLSLSKSGEDFSFKEYFKNFKLKNIDLKYILILFTLTIIISRNPNILSIIFLSVMSFSLLLAFTIDYKYMIIPDTSSILITAVGTLNIIINFSKEFMIDKLIGMLVGFCVLFIIDLLCKVITKTEAFGFGDMKLLSSIGLFLGYKSILLLLVLSIIISGIFSIMYLIIKGIKYIKDAYIPFGPFIVISTYIVLIIPADTIIEQITHILDKIV